MNTQRWYGGELTKAEQLGRSHAMTGAYKVPFPDPISDIDRARNEAYDRGFLSVRKKTARQS